MPVTFGSAHLLVQRMPDDTARALLDAALQAGASRLDTAPLYGHGGSEGLVAVVAAAHPGLPVTTKLGLEPQPAPPAWRLAAGHLLRRLPALRSTAMAVRARLRPATAPPGVDPQAAGPSGRFGSDAARRSIERSLQRLRHIDRLLLHEVHPADITDELLELLLGYQRRGDVAALGVATGNAVTAQALQRGHGLFTVAHVSADALALPVLPALRLAARAARAASTDGRQLQVVGHGVLGAEGRALARLQQALRGDATLQARWDAAVGNSRFAHASGAGNTAGLVAALCARAAAQGFDELLVATSRLPRVTATVQAAAQARAALPAAAAELLDSVFGPAPASVRPGQGVP